MSAGYHVFGRAGALARLLLLLLPIMSLLVLCCDRAERHKVLTFVFDGVPPLDYDPNAAAAAAGGTTDQVALKPKPSRHEPASKCETCHGTDTKRSYSKEIKLVAAVPDLCFGCHEDDRYDVSMHGPVLTGECVFCHKPHNSAYPKLLVATIPDLCYRCHVQKDMVDIEGHSDKGYFKCLKCHNAHSSSKNKLLK
ncbi:MAG: cytochrome c3 family protein [Planctomycetota bacterium]|jgi:predicted CXXCH cytochrome family protein